MEVDSFLYVSRLVTRYYKLSQVEAELPVPWSPLKQPLNQASFGLVTSGGLFHRGHEPPFDLEREAREPSWGDPSFRTIPTDIAQDELGVSHHHINGSPVKKDINVLLPANRFHELVEEGQIGKLAHQAYSFMGYQGYPADLSGWKEIYGPQVAQKLLDAGVNCVFLTTAWPECAANVPVLARLFESLGMSTIMVTNMPYWAEKIGVPRTLGVEFPFGQIVGQPGNLKQQRRVISRALKILEDADQPGTIVHFQEKWPVPVDEAIKECHPDMPPPIMNHMGRHIGHFLRGIRRGQRL